MKSFDITSNSRLAYDLSKYPTKGHKLPHTTHDNRCFMKIAELNEGEHTVSTINVNTFDNSFTNNTLNSSDHDCPM